MILNFFCPVYVQSIRGAPRSKILHQNERNLELAKDNNLVTMKQACTQNASSLLVTIHWRLDRSIIIKENE